MRRYAGAIWCLLVVAAICLGGGADAETRADVKGKTIKIVVPLQIMLSALFDEQRGKYVLRNDEEATFPDPISGEEVFFDQMKSSWETLVKRAADMWTDAFRRFPYRGCYDAEIEIPLVFGSDVWDEDLSSLSNFKSKIKAGHHWIYYRHADDWTYIHYRWFEGRRPFAIMDPTGDPTSDTRYPYENTHFFDINKMLTGVSGAQGEGYMSAPFEYHELAHEIGHLMGLADDFVRIKENGKSVIKIKPGREGTFMAEHESKNIDRILIKRIGDLIAGLDGKEFVETCRCWAGRVSLRRREWHDPDPHPDPQRRTCDVSQDWTAAADVVLREHQPVYFGGGKSRSKLQYRRVEAEVTDTLRAGRDCRTTTFRRKGVIAAPTLEGPSPPPGEFGGNITYAAEETDVLFKAIRIAELQGLDPDMQPDRVPGQYVLALPSLCGISEKPWKHSRRDGGNVTCKFDFDPGSPGSCGNIRCCEAPRFLENDMARMTGNKECSKDWQFTSEIQAHSSFKAEWDLERIPCAAVPRK